MYHRPKFKDIFFSLFFLIMSILSLATSVFGGYLLFVINHNYFLLALVISLYGVPVMGFFGMLFSFHAKECIRFFEFSDLGIIGWRKNRIIQWSEITELGIAPYSCGKLRTRYFNEDGRDIYIICGGNTEHVPEFGLFTLSFLMFFKKFGKIGLLFARIWINGWMEKDLPDNIAFDLPDKIIHVSYNSELYRYIDNHVPDSIERKIIYEKP